MEIDRRTVIHFMVSVAPGEPGLLSVLPKNAAALPPVLRKGLVGSGQTWCFSCSPQLRSSPRHHGTGEACFVNCLLCRKTKAWIDAPDCGAYAKDPSKPRGSDDLKKFLDKEDVVVPEVK